MINIKSTTLKLTIILFCAFLAESAHAVIVPSLASGGTQLEITEATICLGQTITMIVPENGNSDNYTWFKGTEAIGQGYSLSITNFTDSEAGEYKVIQQLAESTDIETSFKLNFLTLGKDVYAHDAQTIKFSLAEGPEYKWSSGATSNNFTSTFQESATISVSAMTEFGHLASDEKFININPASAEVLNINDNTLAAAPYMESDNIQKAITAATICKGSAVTLFVPDNGAEEKEVTWFFGNTPIGLGFTLEVNDFNKEKAGEYYASQVFTEDYSTETYFNLNILDLGNNVSNCGSQTINFSAPEGPEYTWSTGATSNNFTATFEESTSISVSAITEFGSLATDEFLFEMVDLETQVSVSPIMDNDCASQVDISLEAIQAIFPVYVFAYHEGVPTTLGTFAQAGNLSIILDDGDYSQLVVMSSNGCISHLEDLHIESGNNALPSSCMKSVKAEKEIEMDGLFADIEIAINNAEIGM